MFGAFIDMSPIMMGSGGPAPFQTDPSGALKVVIVGDERVNATADIISRLQARDPRMQGIHMDGILYALVDEIALLRVEIEKLKRNQNQTVQPHEAPATG